jgi:hypothetical protein
MVSLFLLVRLIQYRSSQMQVEFDDTRSENPSMNKMILSMNKMILSMNLHIIVFDLRFISQPQTKN